MSQTATIIKKPKKEKLKKTNWFFAVILTLLTVYAVVMVGILVWAFLTSLKTYPMFRKNCFGLPSGWPWEWNWAAYVDAFKHFKVSKGSGKGDAYLAEMFAYSLIYAIGCAFFKTEGSDLTEQETYQLLALRKLDYLKTIRNCALFFTIGAIISMVVALIITLATV